MKNISWQEQLGALVCAIGSFSLYFYTLSPNIQGFDSAELTIGAYDLGFVHPPGYPLYLTLGKLITYMPVENVGYRLNLMSAIFASLSAYTLFRLLFRQSNNFLTGLIFTTLLVTAPPFWSQAIRAEVYTLHLFLMTSSLLFWFIGYSSNRSGAYIISFLILGLGAANHPTTILLWLPLFFITITRKTPTPQTILIANGFAVIIAAICYLYFPLRAGAELQVDYIRPYFNINPGNLSGILWMISGRPFQCLLINQAQSLRLEFSHLINFLWTSSLGFGFFFSIWGWVDLNIRHLSWNRLLSLYFIANMFIFINYNAIDKEVMFLPLLVILSIWGTAGFLSFSSWITNHLKSIDPQSLHFLLGLGLISILILSLFNDLSSVSLRNDRRIYEYSQKLLLEVKPDTVIVNHWATASVMDYLQIVEGLRPDVRSLNVDFYFLGIQNECQPPTDLDLLENGWVSFLLELSKQERLCFIEPLHGLPKGYSWVNNRPCWYVIRQDIHP